MSLYNNSILIKPYWAQIEGTRGKQEDSANWYYYPDGSGVCAILADGIGGGGDGDKASKTVVAAFTTGMEKYGRDLRKALKYANVVLKREKESSRVSNTKGCGCTLVAVSIVNGWLSYISVGDSHLFLHKKGRSLGGTINYHHSGRGSKITSAVTGFYELVEPGTEKSSEQRPYDCRENFARFDPGDRLVLASDGLDTYENEKGSYRRLEKLLTKYPVGGEADAQTIVTHILHELEMSAGHKLEMARAQLWTPEQIVTLQDNATILLVEAFPASQEQNVAPVSPRVAPPVQQTPEAKKKRVAREDNTASAGVGTPIVVEPTSAAPAPSGNVEKEHAKEIRNSMDWRNVGLGAAVVLVGGIALGGLIFSGADSKPGKDKLVKVQRQGAEKESPALKDNESSSGNKETEKGNSGSNVQIEDSKESEKASNRIVAPEEQLNSSHSENSVLEQQFISLVEASLQCVGAEKEIELFNTIAGLVENIQISVGSRVQIREKLIKKLSNEDNSYNVETLKKIGETKAEELWKIVVDDIKAKTSDVWQLIPDGVADASWGEGNDDAPDKWQLLRYMASLKNGETSQRVSNTVLFSMGDAVTAECNNKLAENINKNKKEDELQNALTANDIEKIWNAYNAAGDLLVNRRDELVKDWLSKKDKQNKVIGLNFDSLGQCVLNNKEKFIELALQVVEARLQDTVGTLSGKAKDIYAPLKKAAGLPEKAELTNDFIKKLLVKGSDSPASFLCASLWFAHLHIEGKQGIITEPENKITKNWGCASTARNNYPKIEAIMEAVIDALDKESKAQQVQ